MAIMVSGSGASYPAPRRRTFPHGVQIDQDLIEIRFQYCASAVQLLIRFPIWRKLKQEVAADAGALEFGLVALLFAIVALGAALLAFGL